jgi:hypothetical protein
MSAAEIIRSRNIIFKEKGELRFVKNTNRNYKGKENISFFEMFI